MPLTPSDSNHLTDLMRRGEVIAAYDFAVQGLQDVPGSLYFRHAAVLCLARAGAGQRARQEFINLKLDDITDDENVIALDARLWKDLALNCRGTDRHIHAEMSASLYAKAFALRSGHYPGINMATMMLLAGEALQARKTAQRMLSLLSEQPRTQGEAAYYQAATAAEAHLLLEDVAAAIAALSVAIGCDAKNYTAHASTLRQLELIADEMGLDITALDPLRPPKVVHFTGHIFAVDDVPANYSGAIFEALKAEQVGFGYGALAAGADIIFAECLLAMGAELHVVLPVEQASFIETSVKPFGETWVQRFHECMARATSVRFASRDRYSGDDRVFAYASQYAMGAAILRASSLATHAVQIAVWDGETSKQNAGTAVDIEYWQQTKLKQTIITLEHKRSKPVQIFDTPRAEPQNRAMKAMVFADMQGYGALDDKQIPLFFKAVMTPLAQACHALLAPAFHAETWGDGLFLVFDTVADAATAALALLERHSQISLSDAGLPASLGLRVAGHYGPVHIGTNPFLGTKAVIGSHVVVAARIEPDVPAGACYVSEHFACALAALHPQIFSCSYVGRTQQRKNFAPLPVFNLGIRRKF